MTRLSIALAGLLAMALVAILAVSANAATGPLRTAKQATDYIGARISSGQYDCFGRNGQHTDLYRSFTCYTADWEKDTSTAYRVDTRPHGRWAVRVLD